MQISAGAFNALSRDQGHISEIAKVSVFDRYEIPQPRATVKRTIETGAAVHNAFLLANQLRTSGGMSWSANLIGENGKLVWKRVDAVIGGRGARAPARPTMKAAPVVARAEDYELPGPLQKSVYGRLYGALLAYGDNGDDLPGHTAMAGIVGFVGAQASPTYMSNLYSHLEKRGYLERGRFDAGGRYVKITATQQVIAFAIEGLEP